MTVSEEDIENEEEILKESIVSAVGLSSDNVQIGIRGDPSMRETTFQRKRYKSNVDEHIDELIPAFEELLLRRSTYKLFVGFNNGEIRTTSVFDPLREEIHSAEKLCDRAYVLRQFPEIGYSDKIQLMRNLYAALHTDPIYRTIPVAWQNIMQKRSQNWKPIPEGEISDILVSLPVLRMMQDYYLRNVTISIVQGIVRMQFNCDGTQLVPYGQFKRFLDDNLPASLAAGDNDKT
jgi:hypothetical protein